MFSPISGASYSSYYAARSAHNTTPTTQPPSVPAAQTETVSAPVPPVAPVREVISNDNKFSIEALLNQHSSDPVAMAARMRIQHTEQPSGQRAPFRAETSPTEQEPMKSAREVFEDGQCQTCENRKYQDGSDDPGVSFKTATELSPEEAATAVRGHEMEHVIREQSKASREDREVISQSVTIKTAICPECGTVYTAGGTTRTVTKGMNGNTSEETPDPTTEPSPAAA